MKIKRPFSWTSCSRGPSEVKRDRRAQEWEARGCPAARSACGEIRPWFLSPPPGPAPEEALLGGPGSVLSHQRRLRAVAGRAVPAGNEQPLAPGLPGAPAAHNFLLLHSALKTQLRCSTAPRSELSCSLSPSCSQEAGCQLQLVSAGAGTLHGGWGGGGPATPSCSHFFLVLVFSLNWEAGVQAREWLRGFAAESQPVPS